MTTDYNPAKWRSTKIQNGYTYTMRYHSDVTLKRLIGVKFRIIDRRFFHQPSVWNGERVMGWIKFREPLQLWDAMEAGLMPVFRKGARQ